MIAPAEAMNVRLRPTWIAVYAEQRTFKRVVSIVVLGLLSPLRERSNKFRIWGIVQQSDELNRMPIWVVKVKLG